MTSIIGNTGSVGVGYIVSASSTIRVTSAILGLADGTGSAWVGVTAKLLFSKLSLAPGSASIGYAHEDRKIKTQQR